MSFRTRQFVVIVSVFTFLVGGSGEAYSQAIVGAQTALDNAAAAGSRSPGDMVSAGVAQAMDFANRAAAGTVITEPAPGTSPRAQLLSDTMQILFDQLNQAILLFNTLLRQRAGLSTLPSGSGKLGSLLGSVNSRKKAAEVETEPGRLASFDRLQREHRAKETVDRGKPVRAN